MCLFSVMLFILPVNGGKQKSHLSQVNSKEANNAPSVTVKSYDVKK